MITTVCIVLNVEPTHTYICLYNCIYVDSVIAISVSVAVMISIGVLIIVVFLLRLLSKLGYVHMYAYKVYM